MCRAPTDRVIQLRERFYWVLDNALGPVFDIVVEYQALTGALLFDPAMLADQRASTRFWRQLAVGVPTVFPVPLAVVAHQVERLIRRDRGRTAPPWRPVIAVAQRLTSGGRTTVPIVVPPGADIEMLVRAHLAGFRDPAFEGAVLRMQRAFRARRTAAAAWARYPGLRELSRRGLAKMAEPELKALWRAQPEGSLTTTPLIRNWLAERVPSHYIPGVLRRVRKEMLALQQRVGSANAAGRVT